jgi:hypothetical protein
VLLERARARIGWTKRNVCEAHPHFCRVPPLPRRNSDPTLETLPQVCDLRLVHSIVLVRGSQDAFSAPMIFEEEVETSLQFNVDKTAKTREANWILRDILEGDSSQVADCIGLQMDVFSHPGTRQGPSRANIACKGPEAGHSKRFQTVIKPRFKSFAALKTNVHRRLKTSSRPQSFR